MIVRDRHEGGAIQESADPTVLIVVKSCATEEDWRKIDEAARNYDFAEDELVVESEVNVPPKWPQSYYGGGGLDYGGLPLRAATGNNSNTFVRMMLKEINREAPFNAARAPGRFEPVFVSDPGFTPEWGLGRNNGDLRVP